MRPFHRAQRGGRGKPRYVSAVRIASVDRTRETRGRIVSTAKRCAASLTELTAAMGINRPSLYAAFGDKATLFREAVAYYGTGPGRYVRRALGQPRARQVAEMLLRGTVAMATDAANPAGCLWVQGALVASTEGEPIRREMTALRDGGTAQVRERLERARHEGDLPAGADVQALTLFLVSVMNGIAVQASSGRSREALNSVVDLALRVWPA